MTSPDSDHVSLNIDILATIVEALSSSGASRTEILSVMRASRTFYRVGIKVLLDCGVVLEDNQAASSFYAFLSWDNYARVDMLQSSLTLKPFVLSPTTAKKLCAVLQRVSGLRTLAIHDADILFSSSPALMGAIANMKSLQHFQMKARQTTREITTFLRSMRSRLTTVDLSFDQSQQSEDTPCTMDLSRIFARSRSTLTTLRITGLRTAYTGPVLPQIQTFSASALITPFTRNLILAMPSLTVLRLDGVIGENGRLADAATARKQRGLNRSIQHSYGSWRKLDHVSGPLTDVYALGLTCEIEELSLYASPECEREMLFHVLQTARGLAHLDLTTCENAFDLSWPIDADDPKLRELENEVPSYAETIHERTQCSLDKIFRAHMNIFGMAECTPKTLRLRVQIPCPLLHCHFIIIPDPDVPPQSDSEAHSEVDTAVATDDSDACPMREALLGYDLSVAAADFIKTFPSLRGVTLELAHNANVLMTKYHEATP